MRFSSLRPRLVAATAGLAGVALLAGCFGLSGNTVEPPRLPELRISNLHAPGDPGTYDLTTGVFTRTGTSDRVYVNLKTGQILSEADSATTLWDICFKGPRIFVNSGISGPGDAAAIVQAVDFDAAGVVPEDNAFRQDQAGGDGELAISALANTAPPAVLGWRSEREIPSAPTWARMTLPLAGRTIFVRCTNGWFAKVQIINFYQGQPEIDLIRYNSLSPTLTSPEGSYYSLRWVVQPNGTRQIL